MAADDLLQRNSQQIGQALIAIEHGPIGAERRRALVHCLHQGAIGILGALQGEYLLAFRTRHDHGIHVARLDGADHFLRFGELVLSFGKLGPKRFNLAYLVRRRR